MNRNTFTIFLGDAQTMSLQAWNPLVPQGFGVVNIAQAFGLKPIDLTSVTDIAIELPNADGSTTTLLKSMSQVVVTSAVLGQFTAAISSAVSALLNVGQFQDFTVTLTFGSAIESYKFIGCLSVFEVT